MIESDHLQHTFNRHSLIYCMNSCASWIQFGTPGSHPVYLRRKFPKVLGVGIS